MDNSNQLMIMKEKLEFSGIFIQTFKLPIQNPNFILLFLITSCPLFFFLLLQEIIFLQSLIQALEILSSASNVHGYLTLTGYDFSDSLFSIRNLIENVSASRLLTSLLLMGIIHLLDLLNTIITVHTASVMYAGEPNPMNLKQILCAPIKKVGFKGPLITSICALILSSLTSIGLSALAINLFLTRNNPCFVFIFGVLFMALLTKHIEWSAIWNMGMVLSILEEKHGDVAIGISAYLSRGCRKRGFLLELVFFAWKIGLRISCLYYVYVGWHSGSGGIGNWVQVIAGKVCLDCVGNFMMWVGFVIYFNDCKRRLQEKKFDGAEGKVAQAAPV